MKLCFGWWFPSTYSDDLATGILRCIIPVGEQITRLARDNSRRAAGQAAGHAAAGPPWWLGCMTLLKPPLEPSREMLLWKNVSRSPGIASGVYVHLITHAGIHNCTPTVFL